MSDTPYKLKPVAQPPPPMQDPQQAAAEEQQKVRDIKRQEVLNRLELESQEGRFSRLARSKSFWYGVFGTIFFFTMIALIAWAARDMGWTR